ncbi:MAG: DUF4010 domain-containing protein [Thermoguttaceae bacterium]|nr:DUF4010 domain-containing protein [Thermoguttaceae bacterium]
MFSAFPLFSTTTAGAETALSESTARATEIAQTLQFTEVSETRLIFQLALSLGLGLLIGLQRESARSGFGGVRTFPLIAVFGTLGALASTRFGVWILPSGLLCVALIGIAERAFSLARRWIRAAELNASRSNATVSDAASSSEPSISLFATKTNEIKDVSENEPLPRRDFGATTLVSALATYCVGAILANPAWTLVGLEAGAIVAILLQFKRKLHEISGALGENDLNAIMQFALVSFVVLPILPNQNFGPFGAFNPFEAWLTVALIVGMSLAGYVVYKFYGANAGVLFGGFVGGAVSSAATTTSYSKAVATGATSRDVAAVVILLASATQTVRALILEASVSQEFFYRCVPASVIFIAASVLPALWIWRRIRRDARSSTGAPSASSGVSEQKNPTQWKTALTFGALYVVILFAIKASNALFGDLGTVASVAISGLVEMNAVALSVARLATTDPTTMQDGWKLIMIASIFSYIFKIGVVFSIGGARFGWKVVPLFAIPCGVALASVLLF